MRNIILALASLSLVAGVYAAPPSDQSIDELFTAMNLRGTLDQVLENMDQGIKSGMQQGIQQAAHGAPLSSDQRAKADELEKKLSAAMHEELSYDKMKEIYRKAYSANFSQEEVNGLTAFFKSPAGKAYVEKLPTVMQTASNEVQSRVGPLVQKLNTLQQQFLQQIQSGSGPKKP